MKPRCRTRTQLRTLDASQVLRSEIIYGRKVIPSVAIQGSNQQQFKTEGNLLIYLATFLDTVGLDDEEVLLAPRAFASGGHARTSNPCNSSPSNYAGIAYIGLLFTRKSEFANEEICSEGLNILWIYPHTKSFATSGEMTANATLRRATKEVMM